jgi:hypothetical protein
MAKCFFHEALRVFNDRLYPEDYELFDTEVLKKVTEFDEFDKNEVYGRGGENGDDGMLLFTSFITNVISGEFSYIPIES